MPVPDQGHPISLRVNGEERVMSDVEPSESLLFLLRERLGLYGTKNACEQGECGSCAVFLDGDLVCACLVAAVDADGVSVTTVEGAGGPETGLSAIQQAMVSAGAVQCGFCTPGFVMCLEYLLSRNAALDEDHLREFLSGNLCRCTGYGRILEAAKAVLGDAGLLRQDAGVPTS